MSGAHSIAIDECMDLAPIGAIAQEHAIGFIGNLHSSKVLFEEAEEVILDVRRCIEEGGRFPGYVFGLGAPLTQYISPSRMDEIVALYRQRCHT